MFNYYSLYFPKDNNDYLYTVYQDKLNTTIDKQTDNRNISVYYQGQSVGIVNSFMLDNKVVQVKMNETYNDILAFNTKVLFAPIYNPDGTLDISLYNTDPDRGSVDEVIPYKFPKSVVNIILGADFITKLNNSYKTIQSAARCRKLELDNCQLFIENKLIGYLKNINTDSLDFYVYNDYLSELDDYMTYEDTIRSNYTMVIDKKTAVANDSGKFQKIRFLIKEKRV